MEGEEGEPGEEGGEEGVAEEVVAFGGLVEALSNLKT